MSGRKQHFIPQSLLKGFGFEKGKNTYVVAYTYDRGTFSPSTEGIGAERYFYSELEVDGEPETLDDSITTYETPLATVLRDLRSLDHGQSADNAVVAEFVTHLAVRNDHFRKSMSSAGAALFQGVADTFASEGRAKAMLGLAGEKPSAIFREEMVKAFAEYRPLFDMLGMSEEQFNDFAFGQIRANFGTFYAEMKRPLVEAFSDTSGKAAEAAEAAANAQRRTLSRQLAPELRVQKLAAYDWRVVHVDAPLVLPDCVAVTLDEHQVSYPLMLADPDTTEAIFMPLSRDRLLVGSQSKAVGAPRDLNRHFAACSWDFFVASERSAEFEQLRSTLRTRVTQFVDETIEEALAETLQRNSEFE